MYMYFTSENHMYIYVDINENKMIKLMHIEIVGHEMDREEYLRKCSNMKCQRVRFLSSLCYSFKCRYFYFLFYHVSSLFTFFLLSASQLYPYDWKVFLICSILGPGKLNILTEAF